MPFNPLTTHFTDFLDQLDPDTATVLELGSGEGGFRALLPPGSPVLLGLDLRQPALGTVCDLVGDARHPPLRPGSIDLLVAANLVRHLVPRHRLAEFIRHWRSLLKPAGALFIFEDEPSQATPAERNFGDLQAFLAQLMPESRGSLLALSRFRKMIAEDADVTPWTFGFQRNEETLEATEVMRFLGAGEGTPTGPVARLIRAIGRDGVAPGRYWWAQAGACEPDGSE